MHEERRPGVFGTKEAETANKRWLGIIRVYWIWVTRFGFNDWTGPMAHVTGVPRRDGKQQMAKGSLARASQTGFCSRQQSLALALLC